jgi:hypothetical protein
MTPEEVAAKIAAVHGRSPRPSGSSWSVRCPAHEDRNPSLSVGTGRDGKVLITCHAGCPVEAVLAAAELTWQALFIPRPSKGSDVVAKYTYTDELGKPLFQVRRLFPKDFTGRSGRVASRAQQRPEGVVPAAQGDCGGARRPASLRG